MNQKDLSVCPRCGKNFHCSKSGKCWCYEIYLPLNILEQIEEQYDSCLCPVCLDELSKSSRDPSGKISMDQLARVPYKNKNA
jgi:hypothetical protein